MKDLEFEFYTRPNGCTEFAEYLDNLNIKARVKLLARINIVTTYGPNTGVQHNWVKPLKRNLYEVCSRVSNDQQHGFYSHIDGVHYVIIHDFTKRAQKTPPREINYVKKLRNEYFVNRRKQ